MCTLLLVLLLIAGPAFAQAPTYPNVIDTSLTEPDGDRVMQLAIAVPAPPEEVYARWTTAEGWRAFAVPHARVDFRVGGIIETNYGATFTPGDPANIKNEILAYVPGRMLAIRNVQAPPGFPHPAEFRQVATTLEIDPHPAGSLVTLTAAGFARGAAFDELYVMFWNGNSYTLEKLRQSFVEGPVDRSKRE